MQLICINKVTGIEQGEINFFISLLLVRLEETPNKYSWSDSIKVDWLQLLNHCTTFDKKSLVKRQSEKVCSIESCSPQYKHSLSSIFDTEFTKFFFSHDNLVQKLKLEFPELVFFGNLFNWSKNSIPLFCIY